jgi:hypothetical protein
MNLIKQIAIQLIGSALGLFIIVATKVSYTVWLPAFTTMYMMWLYLSLSMLITTALLSSLLNKPRKVYTQGNGTFIVPAGVTSATVVLHAGGGGGGGCQNNDLKTSTADLKTNSGSQDKPTELP